MPDFSTEELLEAAIYRMKNGERLPLNRCNFCGFVCCYFTKGDRLYYDSACDCGEYISNPYRRISYHRVEDLLFYVDQESIQKRWHLPETCLELRQLAKDTIRHGVLPFEDEQRLREKLNKESEHCE